MTNKAKAKAPTNNESTEEQPITGADRGADDESSSESEPEVVPVAASPESGPSRPSKKKKKKRSKIARAISVLKGDDVPQAVVDQVVAKVKEEHGESSPVADEDAVREVLKQLRLKDVAEGKVGFGGKNQKDTGDHKVWHLRRVYLQSFGVDASVITQFWATQPVPHYGALN
jgi:glycylpeptide N-tetradecanoyltransferase